MASYNPETDRITGAKKGSLTYWHEKGHQWVEHKTGLVSASINLRYFLILYTLGFLAAEENRIALYILVSMFLMDGLHEVVAWVYAYKHFPGQSMFKSKRGKRN